MAPEKCRIYREFSDFSVQDFCWNPDDFSLCFEGLGLIDIDPRHQPVKLPPGKIPDLRLLPGPLIAAADRQPLIDQYEAIRFTEQSFDPIPSSSTEKEESTGRRIHLKLVFDNGAESVNGFPHIRIISELK